jgi:hypothetical protein
MEDSDRGFLVTGIPPARNCFALTLRGPTYAPQVTHDRPQIFPLTAATRPRVSKPRIQSSKTHSFSKDNCNDGVLNHNHNCRGAQNGTQKLRTCQEKSEPSVRPLSPYANKV